MALIDLWENSREQLADKHVHQIISVAGDGRLRDGSPASEEFRAFFAAIAGQEGSGSNPLNTLFLLL